MDLPKASADPPSTERIVLLGTGTCQLQEDRRASSVLVELDGLRLVYDLGRGIADRLAGLGYRQDDLRHVVFSHFHPDHVSDLVPFLQAAAWSRQDPRTEDLHLWGPLGLEVQMMRILGLFGPDHITREHWRVRLHEVRGPREGEGRLEIEGRELGWAHLPPADNHGLAFELGGRRVVLTGDSSFHAQEVGFLRGAHLAVIDSGHLEEAEIVELAVQSGVGILVCSHVYHELDPAALEARAHQRGFGGRVLLGRDLDVFESGRDWSRPGSLR